MNDIYLNCTESIQACIDRADPTLPLRIHLSNGIYREKLRIERHNVWLIGAGIETKIVYGDFALKVHQDGSMYQTFRTPTVTIIGDRIRISHLTIINDAGDGSVVGQAVALAVYGDAFVMDHGRLIGHQDTLFLGPLPPDLCQRYHGLLAINELTGRPIYPYFFMVDIEGDVDFIFGGASALFEECQIIARRNGYIAAPSTAKEAAYGLIFHQCHIISRGDAVYLARPWREHGCTFFNECTFLGGFHEMRYHDWEKTEYRFYENPYVKSPMSLLPSKERKEDILRYIKKHYNRQNI